METQNILTYIIIYQVFHGREKSENLPDTKKTKT